MSTTIRRCPALGAILEVAAEELGITAADLVGPNRYQEVTQARQLVMLLLRQRYGLSMAAIGGVLGGRDHSTVSYGLGRAEALLDNEWLAESWRDLIARLDQLERPKPLAERRRTTARMLTMVEWNVLFGLLSGGHVLHPLGAPEGVIRGDGVFAGRRVPLPSLLKLRDRGYLEYRLPDNAWHLTAVGRVVARQPRLEKAS